MPPTLSPYSRVEAVSLPKRWVEACEKSLGLADWTGTPQVRSIQAILLLSFFHHNDGCVPKLTIQLGDQIADLCAPAAPSLAWSSGLEPVCVLLNRSSFI